MPVERTKPMSDTAFLIATAAVVAFGVALRLVLPRDGFAAAPKVEAEQATGG